MIEELEQGLRVPGTTISRVIRPLNTIEPGAKLTEADRLRGSALGWAVSVSDLMLNSGKVYYHQSIEGALELALEDKRRLAAEAAKPKSRRSPRNH